MAYKIPGPAHDTVRWYVPDVEGNETRKGDQQVRVKLRHPTEGERRRFIADYHNKEGDVVAWQDHVLEACVLDVENYETASGAPIKTAEDLIKHGEVILVSNVAAEAASGYQLTEDQKKNSESSLGSNLAGTQV